MARQLLFVLLLAGASSAQFQPEGTSVYLYFPQLADGGSNAADRWQTVLTFTNPSILGDVASQVVVDFFNDSGQPLSLDFGYGLSPRVTLTVPPNGIRVLRSRMSSSATVIGWATARASYPVQGMVSFRQLAQGKVRADVAVPATLPTGNFWSSATGSTGVAIANVYPNMTISVSVILRDANGLSLGERTVVLAPLGHRAFNVSSLFAGLGSGFVGTMLLRASPPTQFVALTLSGEDDVLASLPSGRFVWPVAHHERIWNAYSRLLATATKAFPTVFARTVTLRISTENQVNAYASPDGNVVQINAAMSQLIGDSDAEMAFVIAHELAHIWQIRTGNRLSEPDADVIGMALLIPTGYDPYATAGVMGKLQMAAGAPGLIGELVRDFVDPHRSFSTRIDNVLSSLSVVCSQNAEMRDLCASYKRAFHPNFPPILPLAHAPEGARY
ncbi:MAG: M48 family metalloprotease [Bryobacterales bacterium]|nr:M48 family metalloprotease [Bryobacterales bacterium]